MDLLSKFRVLVQMVAHRCGFTLYYVRHNKLELATHDWVNDQGKHVRPEVHGELGAQRRATEH